MVRAVIDTSVLFEGLSSRGPAASVVDAWVRREFVPCVSTALALEYEEVLTNKLGDAKRKTSLAALQALLDRAEFVPIVYTVRPMSPDPDDDFVIDCAFNAGAHIVTYNTKDFRGVTPALRIEVLEPQDLLARIGSS